jgi:hypothetical protein
MHGRNKEFGCDPSRSGQISARPPPIRSRNLGKTSRRSASTPAVGMRPLGLGSGRSPSSTFLRVSRTVGHRARWQDTPAAEEVQDIVRRPGHKDIVRLPAGMSSDAGGLEHPDHFIVEMARVQGIARRLKLANNSAISRVRRSNLKGLWRAPWRCHRSGSYFVRPCLHRQRASAEAGPPGQAALSGTKYSTWGRGYPRKHEAGAGGEMEGR